MHPWVVLDLFHCWPLLAVIAKNSEDEVFEIIREILASDLLPVVFNLSREDQVVEVLVFLRLLEWENALDDNE